MNSEEQKPAIESAHLQKMAGQLAPDWLHMVGQQFGMGVIILADNNQIVLENESFIDHCGLPKDLIEKSKNFKDWLLFMEKRGDFPRTAGPNLSEMFLREIRSSANNQKTLSDIAPANGKIINFKSMDMSGGIITIFSEDVTAQRRDEQSLRLAMEMGKSGYFYHVIETNEMYLKSDYLEQLLTSEELELIKHKGFWPVIHENDKAKAKTIWRNSVLNGQKIEIPVRLVTAKNGQITVKFTIKPIRSNLGTLVRVIGFFEDVTHEFKIRRALQKAKDETEGLLKSKTDFLARISHEIRTPMNAVIGIADALIHHNKNPDIIPKLDLIQSSADGILNILDETLHHAKLSTEEFKLDPKPGDPRKSISTICDLWRDKARENNVAINCVIEDSVPQTINFDKHRYEQCLNNLLSNAIKFSPAGKIDVLATRIDKNGKTNMVLAVRDTGIGMSKEQAAGIFNPFQQGDKSIAKRFGGTGLGMNITKSLIEKMGGHISVKTELGKGTIFVMTLPLGDTSEFPISNTRPVVQNVIEESQTPYESLRILVADDNPTNHLVVKSLLEGVVADIYTANDGQEVLGVLEAVPIDIVLMDIHMPIMDGIESTLAIRSAQEVWSDVIIIALTADPEYQQKRLCLNIGMDFAVAKPVKLVDLMNAFDQVLPLRNSNTNIRKIA